ncbi:MAG: hypothetical protein QXH87_03450 [Candidatus Bathyarchaeia archaeon]
MEGSASTFKSFTTERKPKPRTNINIARKGSIVKEKCQQLCEMLLELYPEKTISEDDLVFWIMRYIGADRNTIRAYIGFNGSIARNKRTGEGFIKGMQRKGYLETLGFMHRINRNTWLIHYQSSLPQFNMEAENAETANNTYEANGEFCSKEKISLTHIHDITSIEQTALKEEVPVGETSVSPCTERLAEKTSIEATENKNKNNNNTSVRERNFLQRSSEFTSCENKTLELTPEEQLILYATLNANQQPERREKP